MLSPERLASIRKRLGTNLPARTVVQGSEPPVDPRPRFERGPLKGRLRDPHDRFTEEFDPAEIVAAMNAGDFDANEIFERNKNRFEKWLDESIKREQAAAPAAAEAKAREQFADLGFEIPAGTTAQDYFEQNRDAINRAAKAAQLRGEAAALEARADKL